MALLKDRQLRAETMQRIASRHAAHIGGTPRLAMRGLDVKMKAGRNNREIEVIATTHDLDCHGEIIDPNGVSWDYFDSNKAVFVDHRYEAEALVGTRRAVRKIEEGGVLIGWMLTAGLLKNPAADMIWRNAEQGHLPAASVTVSVQEYEEPTEEEIKRCKSRSGMQPIGVIRTSEVIEVSLTYMPANVTCQTVSISGLAAETEPPEADEPQKPRAVSVLSRTPSLKLPTNPQPKRLLTYGGAVYLRNRG